MYPTSLKCVKDTYLKKYIYLPCLNKRACNGKVIHVWMGLCRKFRTLDMNINSRKFVTMTEIRFLNLVELHWIWIVVALFRLIWHFKRCPVWCQINGTSLITIKIQFDFEKDFSPCILSLIYDLLCCDIRT